MKKLYYLIILTVILGLVLTGCFLSNVGQVPTTGQSGIAYLTKHTEDDPLESILWAGQDINVGVMKVWNEKGDPYDLHVKYVTSGSWVLTETHLAVATALEDIPQKNGNPIPGKFPYQCCYDEDEGEWVFQIKNGGAPGATCDADENNNATLTEVEYIIPLSEIGEGVNCEELLYIAAHAVVQNDSVTVGYDDNQNPIYWTETAWGDEGFGFPGKNWATYFTYEVQCPPCIVTYPETGNVYIGYEDWPNGDFDYNDFGMYFSAVETYTGGCDEDARLTKVLMTFTAMIYDSGGDHLIHITRPIVGDSTVTVTRISSVGGETPAGIYAVTGNVDVVLFDTAKYGWPAKHIGEVVTVEIVVADPSLNSKGTPSAPRWDLDDFMANYDPWAFNNSNPLPGFYGTEWHIDAWQTVTAVSGGGGRLDSRLIGETLPHVLVVPIAEWIPPYEDTCISGPDPYGPYPYFFDYYDTTGGSHPSWYTEFGYTNVEWGGLSW